MKAPDTTQGLNLTFDARREPGRLTLVLHGSAEVREPGALAKVLLGYHEEAVALKASEVIVDFRAVEFMNSSALSAFLRWFGAMKDASVAYRVRFLSDPGVRWQRGSLNALASFAVDHVSVEARQKQS